MIAGMALGGGVMMAAGCSHPTSAEPASPGAPGSATHGTTGDSHEAPAGAVFYLVQTGPDGGVDGKQVAESSYKKELVVCGRAGVTPKKLSTADEKKLGTQRVQIWQDGVHHRTAVLREQYKLQTVKFCSYKLYDQKKLRMSEIGRSYDIDLNKNKGTVHTVSETPSASQPAKPPDYGKLNAIGMHKMGNASMAGQPCVIWHDGQTGSSWCTWSGGTQAGYAIDGSQGFPNFVGTPVLWLKDPDGKYYFKTERFVVGSLPDDSIFDTPKNVQLRDTTATSKNGGS